MSMTMIPSELLKNLPEEMQGFSPLAVICNILPEPVLPILQTYGVYHIKWPQKGERYALTQIPWAALYMDKGDSNFIIGAGRQHDKAGFQDNRIRSLQGAKEIADDLCAQMNLADGGPTSFWGKFVCKGVEPTEEELREAEKRLNSYFTMVVSAGDKEWAKAGRHDMIDSRCKIAARHLNITDRPWLMEYVPNIPCPACREDIRQGAIICRHCGVHLNEDGTMRFEEESARDTTQVAASRTRRRKKTQAAEEAPVL